MFFLTAVYCPCPRWFTGDPVGTYDWDSQPPPICPEPDTRERSYKTEIKYQCPTGYVFDQSNMDEPGPDANDLIFTCEWWNEWDPPITPACKRK